MNYPNPTPIKIGMKGSFAGKQYLVVGRVVLGIVENGTMYYWNEYNLETDGGEVATLVYEVTEDGPEWRIFTMFEPQFAISAEDAAAKRAGDLINLDGENCRVTRVDHSRIFYVEGKAPEGEVVNAKADYFNAVESRKMIVVSWTGSEVECYRGMTITSGMVSSAFNLQGGAMLQFHLTGVKNVAGSNNTVKALFLFAAVAVLLGIFTDIRPSPGGRAMAVKVYSPPSSSFEISGEGTLDGKKYTIAAEALVEVDEVGEHGSRHEYFLTNEEGGSALLIQGMQAGTKDWALLTPLSPVEPMTPKQAAAVITGQIVDVDGVVAVVKEIFRSKATLLDDFTGQPTAAGREVQYGFVGRKNAMLLMVRWNANEIKFYHGWAMKDEEVKAAFGRVAK